MTTLGSRTSSRPRWSLAICSLFIAGSASAQTIGATPTLKITPIAEELSRFGIEEVEADAPIQLEWTASVFSTESYDFEITYDSPSTETSSASRVKIDETITRNENHGSIENARQMVLSMRPSQILPAAHLPSATGANDSTRKIVLRVYRAASPFETGSSASASWSFDYDTKRPPAPSITSVLPGEKRLEVSWAAPSDTTDIDAYELVYGVLPPSDVAPDPSTIDATTLTRSAGSVSKTAVRGSVEGEAIANGQYVAVAVRSIDAYGNVGAPSAPAVGRPQEVSDFYELYKQRGGTDDGGFCFIATAAYGSYAHPLVRVLRTYRDVVLATGPIGRVVVRAYYSWSPPIAEMVRHQAALRAIVRVLLVPIALFAILSMLLPPLLLMGLVLRRFRRSGAALASALVFLVASSADASLPGSRDEVSLGFELRGGPYLPEVGNDSSTVAGSSAFVDVFGSRPNPLYSVGLDLLLYRGIGTAGVGGTFGFMQFVGRGVYADSGAISHDTTVMNLMPLSLEAFYRFDWLAEELDVPFVPYVRGGLAYHVWWVTTGTGDVARSGDSIGQGGTFGLVGRVGVAFVLNVIEPSAARSLYESTGIRSTSIFGELLAADVAGFGSGALELSDQTWNAGLYFEF
ncbi:MAG: hypothetical protein HYV07_06245 [Deltaproteobacteria bacterium]|nr:hypothetical protein [Deltaproteobacteria bacterium]